MPTIKATQYDLLPHDLAAEQAAVGAILIDPDAMIAAREVGLAPGDFWAPKLGMIYGAALDLAERFEPIDLTAVAGRLEGKQNGHGSQLEAIGGPAELARLLNETPTSVHAKHYATMVKRLAQQRRVISAAEQIAVAAQEHEGPIETLYDKITAQLFEAVGQTERDPHLFGTDDALEAYLMRQAEREERARNSPNALLRVWLPAIDHYTGYLRPGALHVVAADTSVGKTVYMEQIAEANAIRGHKVAYYHLELSHEAMLDRRMARLSGIPLRRIAEEGYNGPEVARALNGLRQWHDNIAYIHCPGWPSERIVADMTRLAATWGAEIAVVDYLQKIPYGGDRRINEASLIGQNVERLKIGAEQLAIPLVLGCQVNRAYQAQADKQPNLGNLLGSGDIERKANQVVILSRVGERPSGDLHGKTEQLVAHVAKNTDGPTGRAEVYHRLGYYRLECKTEEGR